MKHISYKKLWKLLIDRDLQKKDLQSKTGIGNSTISKIAKNENINTLILEKICNALECDISDIMEMVEVNLTPENSKNIKK
ncbi:MAG: helix-turn-helix transcriptional regulator [Oscillospiraceae bacterium]|jgi:DNA-binding Xre family transcriptional regulator|nr:helix-turn-helix transcriptional regulator [Oscillospiraceae bacterium]